MLGLHPHQIRFFERVKLERQIKQLQRAAEEAPAADQPLLQQQLAKLRGDLQVTPPPRLPLTPPSLTRIISLRELACPVGLWRCV